jgi:hypothetical protein
MILISFICSCMCQHFWSLSPSCWPATRNHKTVLCVQHTKIYVVSIYVKIYVNKFKSVVYKSYKRVFSESYYAIWRHREDNLHIKHHLLNISRKKQVKIVWQSILLVILNFLYNTIKYDINTLMDAMHSEISLWRAFTIRPGCLQVSFSTKILIKHSGSCSLQRNVIDS